MKGRRSDHFPSAALNTFFKRPKTYICCICFKEVFRLRKSTLNGLKVNLVANLLSFCKCDTVSKGHPHQMTAENRNVIDQSHFHGNAWLFHRCRSFPFRLDFLLSAVLKW